MSVEREHNRVTTCDDRRRGHRLRRRSVVAPTVIGKERDRSAHRAAEHHVAGRELALAAKCQCLLKLFGVEADDLPNCVRRPVEKPCVTTSPQQAVKPTTTHFSWLPVGGLDVTAIGPLEATITGTIGLACAEYVCCVGHV